MADEPTTDQAEGSAPPVPETPAKTAAVNDSGYDEYPERTYAEANQGILVIDPSNPGHQADRIEHTVDYLETAPEGYVAPEYG